MYANMKSEFLYKQISMFVAEYPSTENRRKRIRSLAFSRNGGVYVILPANPVHKFESREMQDGSMEVAKCD
jgi:hypothetical protein